jgi:DNA mismatch repair protein MutS
LDGFQLQLEKTLPRVRNFHVAVQEKGNEILFLREIVPGCADRSYGIQVARLAGIPKTVIERASCVLEDLEKNRKPREEKIQKTSQAEEDGQNPQ